MWKPTYQRLIFMLNYHLSLCVSLGSHKLGIGPTQDATFFYTGSHLSELKCCALIFSANLNIIFTLKSARQNLVIELCRALKLIQTF